MTTPKSMTSPRTFEKVKALIDGVDHLAGEMEIKWGVGRLRLLVSDDFRERFDRQTKKMNTAIWDGQPADVEIEAGRMAAAWRALDAQAGEAGAAPLDPQVWEVGLPDGRVCALVRTMAEQHAVSGDGRYVMVMSLDEIAHLIVGFPELLKVKEEIPGARVEAVRQRVPEVDWTNGDDISELAV